MEQKREGANNSELGRGKGMAEQATPPIVLTLAEDIAAALKRRSDETGTPVTALVERAVEDMLRAERRMRVQEEERLKPTPPRCSLSVACDDGDTATILVPEEATSAPPDRDLFTAASKLTSEMHVVALQEVGRETDKSGKRVVLRECSPGYGKSAGTWKSGATYTLPVSKIGWMIASLEQAKAVLDAAASANRRAVQDARRSRPAEEKAQEAAFRKAWTEQRGGAAWSRAVSLASRHKARCARHGLTHHFDAAEWLALCEAFGFRCSLCGAVEGEPFEVPVSRWGGTDPDGLVWLQPHHRKELALGGDNTIGNILPLCGHCHQQVHDGGVYLCAASDWLSVETAQCERLRPGMLVTGLRRSGEEDDISYPTPRFPRLFPPAFPVGVVREIRLPERVREERTPGSVRGMRFSDRFGIVVEDSDAGGKQVALWRGGKAEVRWITGYWSHGRGDHPGMLESLDDAMAEKYRAEWLRREQEVMASFSVNDLVRLRTARRTNQNRIVELVPPDPLLMIPGQAVLQSYNGKSPVRSVDVAQLSILDSEERQSGQ